MLSEFHENPFSVGIKYARVFVLSSKYLVCVYLFATPHSSSIVIKSGILYFGLGFDRENDIRCLPLVASFHFKIGIYKMYGLKR